MDNERLLKALTTQGNTLQRKAEWTQDMITRQLQGIERAQKNIETAQNMVELFRSDLLACEVVLDALRVKYRGILQEENAETKEE